MAATPKGILIIFTDFPLDENEVVDAEHHLQRDQCQKSQPCSRIGKQSENFHQTALPKLSVLFKGISALWRHAKMSQLYALAAINTKLFAHGVLSRYDG